MNIKNTERINMAKEMRQQDSVKYNPYENNYKRTSTEEGVFYQNEKDSLFFNVKKGCFEGEIRVQEEEFLFQGHLENNELSGKQEVFFQEKDKQFLECSFEVEEGKVKNLKKIPRLSKEDREITR